MSLPFNSTPTRRFEPIPSVDANHAVLCEDCNRISEAENGHCPICESHQILTLANCRIIPLTDKELKELEKVTEKPLSKILNRGGE